MRKSLVQILLKRVVKTYVLSAVVVIVIFLLINGLFVKGEVESEMKHDFALAEKVIRQYYLLGDIVSIRSYLDLWSETRSVSGSFVDASGQILWQSKSEYNSGISQKYNVQFENESLIGSMIISKSFVELYTAKIKNYLIFILLIFFSFVLFLLIFRKIISNSLKPIIILRDDLQFKSKHLGVEVKSIYVDEIDEIKDLFLKVSHAWEQEKVISEQLAVEAQTAIIAAQVAHDIRSPVSALNMALYGLNSIPEDRRILIRNAVQRINDIANSLLLKSKHARSPGLNRQVTSTIEQLAPLIDSLISEKRIQNRNKSNVDIQINLDRSYGLFSKVNANEFKRVLSNLINNSVEAAIPGAKLLIKVSVQSNNNMAQIVLQDNGKGIPKHVLSKLGSINISSGKEGTDSGSGLGVMHAKQTIESFSGIFNVESVIGQGTCVTIELPLAETPSWFVKKIILEPDSCLVSFDDDQSIHQIWSGRLASLGASKYNISQRSFTDDEEFKQQIGTQSQHNTLFLIDYEVSAGGPSGLDVIEEIAKINPEILLKTILVTSRYEEANIRNRCVSLGIRMIPKVMAGYVPIEITNLK